MNADPQRAAVSEVVGRIARELRRLDLWEAEPPSPRRLRSSQPFSCDTLLFHQWLQWRFLPQMRAILEDDEALPQNSAIHTYAEELLPARVADPERLLFLIKTFDELITGSWPADDADPAQ